ncbi:MAG: hypothetical protein Unbinned5081contig1001_22 [Prokaryotic dsDNA virus sp.]|nr:MAG: hypothetical protein Unbinned5081contig1001_22 [Prokaryotic dsDNA virus sp.]|tara:strand:- start:2582 stop:3109 length:528 start_codon:yes stop_codon:yes gene_type:complete
MDPKFLKKVEEAGWTVEQSGERQVMARCPAAGCGMKALLTEGRPIPQVDPDMSRQGLDRAVKNYDDARRILRERREDLRLRIHEVEEAAGTCVDYIAKAEKEGPTKVPNFQLFLDWANSLGLEVVLRPTQIDNALPLRMIADTRERVQARGRRNELDRERRGPEARPYLDAGNRR